MLEVQGLTKRYGKFLALDHIDMEIEAGCIFGFVGPNGAGKTTTMRILSTLMAPTAGTAKIDGISVTESPKEVRRRIGYMPDFFGVYDNLKVIEYLELYGRAAGLSYKQCIKTGRELLEIVLLSDKENAYVDSLSRGMKQRLCLGRSLINSPKLLILDEPASGMDPRARVEMKGILKSLKSMDKTIMISSHILPELTELCDKFGVLEKGKFLFQGTLEEIGHRIHGGKVITISLREPNDAIVSFLRETPNVKEVTLDELKISVAFTGEELEVEKLLYALVEHKFPIIGYMLESENLENIFMEVTNDDANQSSVH